MIHDYEDPLNNIPIIKNKKFKKHLIIANGYCVCLVAYREK
jgi:hypothetical protein